MKLDPKTRVAVIASKLEGASVGTVYHLQELDPLNERDIDAVDLRVLGEVVSGRRVQNASSTALTSDEWWERWEILMNRDRQGVSLIQQLQFTPAGNVDWHRREMRLAEKATRWQDVLFQSSRVLKAESRNCEAILFHALALAKLNRIDEACRTIERAEDSIEPEEIWSLRFLIDQLLQIERPRQTLLLLIASWVEKKDPMSQQALTWLLQYEELDEQMAKMVFRKLYTPDPVIAGLAARIIALQAQRTDSGDWNWQSKNLPPAQQRLIEIAENKLKVDRLREQANSLHEESDYEMLAAVLKELVSIEPDDLSGWTMLAETQARYLHDFKAAELSAREVIRLVPDDRWWWHRRIYLLHVLNDRTEYLNACQAAYNQFATSSDLQDRRFVTVWYTCLPDASKDWPAIRDLLSELLESEPNDFWANASMARVQFRSERYEECEAMLSQEFLIMRDLGLTLFQVMNLYQLEKANEAVKLLDATEQNHSWLAEPLPAGDLGTNWYDTLYHRALYREAVLMIRGGDSLEKKSDN